VKRIDLQSRTNEDWGGKFVDESNYDVLLKESALVYKPDGTLLLALFKKGHSKAALATAWSTLKDWSQVSTNRGVAAGSGKKKRIRADGSVSNVNVADAVNSGIVGYFERTPRFQFCRACAWNLHNPELFAALFPLCEEASELYRQVGGHKYEKQKAAYDKTNPDFKIPGTVFSTLTINKNFRTACHKDAGNLDGTLNVMTVMREGKFAGAHIVLPDFRVAAELDTGDCIVFDAHEFHGNTPLVQITEKFTRCSVVFYYRENMDLCGSASEELEIVKRRELGTPLFQKPEEA
jgi:hypothetical protein